MIFLICTVFIGLLVFLLRTVSCVKGVSILPGSLPVIGHIHLIRLKDVVSMLENLSKNTINNGGISVLRLGWNSLYMITNPEDAMTVNTRCLEKMFIYKFIKPLFGDVLVASEGVAWKRNRRISDLAFKQHILESYMKVFNEQASCLVNGLCNKVGAGYVDVTDEVIRSVLETTCQTTLGMRPDGNNIIDDRYVKACHRVFEIVTQRILRPWLLFDALFNHSNLKKEMDESLETIQELSRKMVKIQKTKYMYRLKNKNENNENEMKSFLEIIIENTITSEGNVFTDHQLRCLCDNVLLAAFDTTTYELLFALVCIGSSEDVQNRIYHEILQFIGEETVKVEHLSKLVYLEAAIKEALRLYPIAPVVARDSTTDIQLGNVKIPAGNSIVVLLWAINRHEAHWGPDAAEYNPQRWLNQATLPKHPNAFTSFSIGRRNCIGKYYAMIYMKTVLVHILRKYRITSDHKKMIFDCYIMLKATSGHLMKLQLR